MAELTTLARPYARAAFEHALAGSALGAWADALATAAAVVSDDRAAQLLGSPSYTVSQKADALIGVCGDSLPEPVQNFVRVLAENAITEEKIDEHAVEAAMKRAEQELANAKTLDPQELEHLQGLVRYAGVQLAVKRRRR